MRLRNQRTGDIVEVPPPDMLGMSVVRLNGEIVENVFYGDRNGSRAVTTGDGRTFNPEEWAGYIAGMLR